MNRTNFPEQMGYANGGDVDPEDFLAKADTLSTADRTRMMDGEPFTTHADSVYSVIARSPSMNTAKRQAKAMMFQALAQGEAGLLPGQEGVVQGNLRHSGLAELTGDVRRPEDNPSLYEYEQYYSPDMRRQLMAKMFGTEGRAAGGLIDGYAGGGIYTMPHLAQMAGGGIYTIPMAGGGMYVPGYGWGGFFRGLSKVASVASMIPGPHQAFTVPIAAGSGAIGGAMDGGGLKGGLKGGAQGFIGAKAGQSLSGAGSAAAKGADIASKAGTLAKGADVASKAGQLAKGVETAAQGASTLSKILDVAQHPAMMAMGYPLLGEVLGSVGGGGLGRMGAPTSSRGGEEIQRVMPSYVTDRQAAQGYTDPITLQGRQEGGMIGEFEEERPPRRSRRRTSRRKPAPKRRPPPVVERPVMPQPFIPPPVIAQPFIPPLEQMPQPVAPPMPQPEVMPQPFVPPPVIMPQPVAPQPVAPRPRKEQPRERPQPIMPQPAVPSEERRRETSEIEDRFEELERELAPRSERRTERESDTERERELDSDFDRERDSQEQASPDFYPSEDRMDPELERMRERFEVYDEVGNPDESDEMETIRAIEKNRPTDDIMTTDEVLIEPENPLDPTPTSMPNIQNPELLARRDAELMANPVTYQRPTMTTVGPPATQFAPRQEAITDIPDWYRAGLMSEQALQTGQPETFLGQDPFSVFAGQQQDPISMFRGPAGSMSLNTPLQTPNMPFLQNQGPAQMGPPPPIVDPGDKFSRPRIEAPRRMVPAEQQMRPPMQMPQPVQPSPDFMPQPVLRERPRRAAPRKIEGGLGGLKNRQGRRSTDALRLPDELRGRADGGMTPQDVPFEGFIEPFEDGTMESSGAVDDRVAVMKPDLSEVGPEQMQMLSALKDALRNPNSEVSRRIIELAKNTFGEKFITSLVQDMLSAGNNKSLENQDDMDRVVEMEFRQNLAEGGSVRVGAAIAPNEYVLTASQVRNVGGGDTEEGARRIKKLARNIDIAGSTTDRPLNVEIV